MQLKYDFHKNIRYLRERERERGGRKEGRERERRKKD